jgi:hypothetical protein
LPPNIHFTLETITRDPLNVRIFRQEFWVTMLDVPAQELARTLKVVKTRSAPEPFIDVSKLPVSQQIDLELRNVQQSITYARERLALR